jgi:hypothetical protein
LIIDYYYYQNFGHYLIFLNKVIENLGETDIIHLVCYGSNALTIFKNENNQNKKELIEKVDGISCRGKTNLWGGLEEAINILSLAPPELKQKKRIFLFSDGLVNEGLKDNNQILRKISDTYETHDIQISAFGLGKDFDETLMKEISQSGIGYYFYIEDAKTIPSFVNYTFGILKKIIGTNAILRIKGAKKIAGCARESSNGSLLLGDLCEDNRYKSIAQYDVFPSLFDGKMESTIIECILEYKNHLNGKETTFKICQNITVYFSTDMALVCQDEPNEVKLEMNLQRVASMDNEMLELMIKFRKGKINVNCEKEKITAILEEQIEILEKDQVIDETEFNGEYQIDILLNQYKKMLREISEGIDTTKEYTKEIDQRRYAVRVGNSGYVNNMNQLDSFNIQD